ncbi:hypothetical protein DYD21_04140 [Rhodohalobacter sp. SW132]|uniref:hypothetical protein n=1 Tax=Rhodohalobacter sp. SW132 TaxID=2293433 RepID=UPI000E24EE31|nr:hypothetical protein [Rhodohalobacter sp. SW132]REL39154.1 hypothetical protein DYD21_04140 [Rhodohalobacter sp. SW132]
MGLFSRLKKTVNQAKYATELEMILDAYTRKMPANFSNGKLAGDLVSSSWEKNSSLFDGELGGKPNTNTVIISSLSESVNRNDLIKGDKHFLMAVLGDLIRQLEETGFKDYSRAEHDLILEAKNTFHNFR